MTRLYILLSVLLLVTMKSNAQINFDFTDSDIDKWEQQPEGRWKISTNIFTLHKKCLHHNFDNNTSGEDKISTSLSKIPSVSSGTVKWSFAVYYNYNPSSTNNWAVFLMSDKDANYMQRNSEAEAYVLGVNFKGETDDILKLWRTNKDKSVSTITETSINWQKDIPRDKYTTIKISRSSAGKWTVKLKKNDAWQIIGEATDNQYKTANYFGIYYKYTKSADKLIWLDYLTVNFHSDNINNHDGIISLSTNNIAEKTIKTNNPTIENKIPILNFDIKDGGGGDNKPLNIKEINIFNNEDKSFVNTVDEAFLLQDGNIISKSKTKDDFLIFTFNKNDLSVPDNKSLSLQLSLKLNTSNLADGSSLSCIIPQIKHSALCYPDGSDFSLDFGNNIISEKINIDVVAQKLKLEVPKQIKQAIPFSAKIYITDKYGNIDTDANQNISIRVKEGNELLKGAGIEKKAEKGIVIFNNLIYDSRNSFNLQAISKTVGIENSKIHKIELQNDKNSTIEIFARSDTVKINSTATTPSEAVNLFTFSIRDFGETDNKPTIIRKLEFVKTTEKSKIKIEKILKNIILKDKEREIITEKIIIKDDKIEIFFPENSLSVEDGKQKNIVLSAYLIDRKIIDNHFFKLKLGEANITEPKGSGLSQNTDDKEITIKTEVYGTQLKFSLLPKNIIKIKTPFKIKVQVTDINGSKDIDYNKQLKISKKEEAQINEIYKGNFKKGECDFKIQAAKYGIFTLLAYSPYLQSVESKKLLVSDNNSTITNINISPLSAVENGNKTERGEAIKLLKFSIADSSETDKLPTAVTKAVFYNPLSADKCNYSDILKNVFIVRIKNEKAKDTLKQSYTKFYPDKFYLLFNEFNFMIQDGKTDTFCLYATIKSRNIKDHQNINCRLATEIHEWKTSLNSSAIGIYTKNNILNKNTEIDINASKLAFSDFPLICDKNKTEKIESRAVSQNLVTDIDFSSAYALLWGNSTISGKSKKGVNKWENLSCPEGNRNKVSFFINDEKTEKFAYTLINTEKIKTIYHADFEDITELKNCKGWLISNSNAIGKQKSLVYNSLHKAKEACWDKETEELNFNGENVFTWQFSLRESMIKATTADKLMVVLMSDTNIDENEDRRAYVWAISYYERKKQKGLWLLKGEELKPLIIQELEEEENNLRHIKIRRDILGNWTVFEQKEKNKIWIKTGQTQDQTYKRARHTGIIFSGKEAGGDIYFDDFMIQKAISSPIISTVYVHGNNSLEVKFSANIDEKNNISPQNFDLRNSKGENVKILEVNIIDNNSLTLKTDEHERGDYIIRAKNITAQNGLKINYDFAYSFNNSYGTVVINELMPDPEPAVSINYGEYIELYNKGNQAVNLKDWQLKIGSSYCKLPNYRMEKKEYLVLYSSKENNFGNDVKSLFAEKMPSLPNTTQLVQLLSPYQEVVSWVRYDKELWTNPHKKEGGWSLEQKDPENLCGENNNWIASISKTGGTPGKENSVFAANPDTQKPEAVRIAEIEQNRISIIFSEVMKINTKDKNLFELEETSENPKEIIKSEAENKTISLIFENDFEVGKYYNLIIKNDLCDCSNNKTEKKKIRFTLPSKPKENQLIINEILFEASENYSEFIEIYNNSDKAFDLNELLIVHFNPETDEIKKSSPCSETSFIIYPNDYVIICPKRNKKYFTQKGVNEAFIIENENFASLTNDKGCLALYSKEFKKIDKVYYNQKWHWTALNSTKDVSLERLQKNISGEKKSNWHSAAESYGWNTPAAKNSQHKDKQEITQKEFSLTKKTFSPDNDGTDDYLQINYKLSKEGFTATIKVYDLSGVLIKRLYNNYLLGNEGYLEWDGTNENKSIALPGIYIIYIETFDGKNTEKYKLPAVLAK